MQFRFADCYIFLTSDFNSPVNHSAHIKADCWSLLEFYLYFWLQDDHVQKFYSYIQRLILLAMIIATVWKPTRHYMHWRFSKSSTFKISLNRWATLICISPQTEKGSQYLQAFLNCANVLPTLSNTILWRV